MTNLFWFVIDAAFAAGWVVAALCLLRLLYHRYLPRWLSVAMWALVAVRLVCPFSIESDISPMPEPLSQTVQSYVSSAPVTSLPDSETPDNAPAVEINQTPAINRETIAMYVWLTGAVGMIGYMFLSYICMRYRVRTATKREHGIYECETVESPFILGVLYPRIYLPYDLSDEQLNNTLAHERAHIARGDHVWKPLAFLLLSVYWFQPLLWVAYHLLCRDIEFACDEKVIRQLSDDERKGYSRALLSAAIGHRRLLLCPLAFGEVGVEARVKGIKRYRKPALVLVAIMCIGCLLVGGWLMTDPPAPTKTTLEDAHVCLYVQSTSRSETDSLLCETGNRLTLRTENGNTVQFQIDKVDTQNMCVTVVTDTPVYRSNKAIRTLEVPLYETAYVYSQAGEQGSRIELSLSLPSSVNMTNRTNESKQILRTDGARLELCDDYFRLHLDADPNRDICGVYEQTDDTLTLTEDAHLTEWVFRKQADGTWIYDASASYRHKKAVSPTLDDQAVLTPMYAYTIKKSNQHYLFTLTDGAGNELLSGYSAKLVKPVFHETSDTTLTVTVNTPAAAPTLHKIEVDLTTKTTKEVSACPDITAYYEHGY